MSLFFRLTIDFINIHDFLIVSNLIRHFTILKNRELIQIQFSIMTYNLCISKLILIKILRQNMTLKIDNTLSLKSLDFEKKNQISSALIQKLKSF